MGLESPTYVNDFTVTNPESTDVRSQGDDHIRNMKSALKSTFPNADRAFYLPTATTKSADFSVVSTDLNKTFFVDASSPSTSLIATLPTLTASNDGWFCTFVKTSSNAVPIMVTPATGTIQSGHLSGLARARRAVSGMPFRAMWSGGAWVVERCFHAPIGSSFDMTPTNSLPNGCEFLNGQTLTNSLLYPEFFVVNSGLVLADRSGRVAVAKEGMGGVASVGRVTTAGSGIDGTVAGSAGGSQNVTLVASNIPQITATTSTTTPTADSFYIRSDQAISGGGTIDIVVNQENQVGAVPPTSSFTPVATNNGAHTHGFTIGNSSPSTVSNMPPAIVVNHVIIVE